MHAIIQRNTPNPRLLNGISRRERGLMMHTWDCAQQLFNKFDNLPLNRFHVFAAKLT